MTAAEQHKRGMLVSLSIGSWSARKYDKRITRETNAAHNASEDAGRYNKFLLPGDAPAYKALAQHIGAIRKEHYAHTLPWDDEGWRVLPTRNYFKYTDVIRKGHNTFDSLLDDFARDYPSLRDQAKLKLNGMYNDEDYPRDVRDRYAWGNDIKPLPSGGDFRCDLPQAEIDAISRRIEDRTRQTLAAAQQDVVKRLAECVSYIHARLSEPEAIFRDTLLSNARELCGILKDLNMDDDAKLEEFRRQTEVLAASTEPQTLRDDPNVRIDTANQVQNILDAMTATYGKGIFV